MRESYPVLSRGSPPSAVRFGEELSRKMGIFRVFLGKGRRNFSALRLRGGEEGIRTPDTLSGMPVFKTGAINHSATSPVIQFYYTSFVGQTRLSPSIEDRKPGNGTP